MYELQKVKYCEKNLANQQAEIHLILRIQRLIKSKFLRD